MKSSRKNLSSGQGLLEAIFAIGILLLVAGAILTLAVANSTGQKASEFQIRANNLAREGIEVVRNIRDTNWLSGADWQTGLAGQTATADFNPATNAWQLSFNPTVEQTRLYLSLATGVHSHSPANGQLTVFRRELRLEEICETADGTEIIVSLPGVCNTQNGETLIGLQVTATVWWTERGQNRQISLVDLLYAWK